MGLLSRGPRRCRRCHGEVTRGVERCEDCGFSPKQMGLRATGYVLLLAPLAWMVAILIGPVAPTLAGPLMVVGVLAFVVSAGMFIVAMTADPHRFGSLFKPFT